MKSSGSGFDPAPNVQRDDTFAGGSTGRPAVNPARHAPADQVRGARGSAPLRRGRRQGFDRPPVPCCAVGVGTKGVPKFARGSGGSN